jgi:hypothetical protein
MDPGARCDFPTAWGVMAVLALLNFLVLNATISESCVESIIVTNQLLLAASGRLLPCSKPEAQTERCLVKEL